MEVLMGIFIKACVAVVVGVICLAGLILYSKKKDREEAQNAEKSGFYGENSPESRAATDSAAALHMACSGDCSKCYSHCGSEKQNS